MPLFPIHRIRALLLLAAAAAACLYAGKEFRKMNAPDTILPGQGVSRIRALKDYFPNLEGTRSDSAVYFLESGRPGPTVLVLGGTHPNEPAGFLAAVALVESLRVKAGRLIVVPQACQSGFTCTDPLEGYPQSYSLRSRSRLRTFRFGSRAANPVEDWPDPIIYRHFPSGQQLSGNETRNLNRAYPGKSDGTTTEKTAFAIMKLIRDEKVNLAFDLHEAAPEIPIINAIVTHEKGRELAAGALLGLELENLPYALELSPPNFHGLSHREWGDGTPAIPFLLETTNPVQGRLRGRTGASLAVDGQDRQYRLAQESGRMRITYDAGGEPLARRVGRHLRAIQAVLETYNELHPEGRVELEGIPSYEEIIRNGVGSLLQ